MNVEQHLEKAFKIISSMLVSGENQELAAVAKSEIKAAWNELKKAKEGENG